ncbi:DNA/RNA non-specific endonuclease [Chondromyces apiculatus]|uniref:Endonuclease n=1 Tax=Chondromyces apiculatus DSM 436 TaxID=1192034 RepID=A0A017TCU0_9BACT|nr:DNA/RNA non-specific endonuclease [Chondromyces apiculatus]EYF06625.1 Hypothetical protein CAP_1755 [Chondromyces apiculatus DSM 436]
MAKRGKQKRKTTAKGPLGAVLALILAALGGTAVTCRPDRWLDDRAGGNASPSDASPSDASPVGAPQGAHMALGAPVLVARGKRAATDDHLLVKPQYALAYSRSRGGPSWVSWRLDASWFGDAPRHKGRFLVDDSLPEGWERIGHDDYTNSGYDRGHMVRSEERTRNDVDNKATFLLTNILPQRHELNAGPWLRLEERCQDLAQKEGRALHVVAGGIYGDRPDTFGKGVAVPDAFYKIAVVLGKTQGVKDVGPTTRVIAVIMPNSATIQDEPWTRYRVSVDEIERRSGYDFLTAVPADVQKVIEARVDDAAAAAP